MRDIFKRAGANEPTFSSENMSSRDISLLQNISLVEETRSLADQVMRVRRDGALVNLARIAELEFIRGNLQDRKRFVRRVLRALVWHLFRIRIFKNLPDAAIDRSRPPVNLPNRYARLVGDLGAWRELLLEGAIAESTDTSAIEYRQKSAETWRHFVRSRSDLPYLAGLKPHNGENGPLRILVLLGGGGLGDALLFSAFIAALKQQFGACEIVFMYEKKILETLYKDNPSVDCTIVAPWSDMDAIAKASRWLGIFDLFIDIYCFLPRYLLCEGSRVNLEKHGEILRGNAALGEMADAFSSNIGLSLLDKAYNVQVLDLIAGFSGLSLNAQSPLLFVPEVGGLEEWRTLGLPERYVTIRDGSNPGDSAEARRLGADRTTKQLPLTKWQEVTSLLKAAGLTIVQIGDMNDPPFAAADIDIRGKISLSGLCFVMKGAVAHVDTEGGLVHFARAVNVKSVVFFGVTSRTFFGYPANLNLESAECNRCSYSNKTWVAKCARGTTGPVCGTTINLGKVDDFLAKEISCRNARKVVKASTSSQDARASDDLEGFALQCAKTWSGQFLGEGSTCSACVIVLDDARSHHLAEARLLQQGIPSDTPFSSGSVYNMPINSGSFDMIVACNVIGSNVDPVAAVTDMTRLLKSNGIFVWVEGYQSVAATKMALNNMAIEFTDDQVNSVSDGVFAICIEKSDDMAVQP